MFSPLDRFVPSDGFLRRLGFTAEPALDDSPHLAVYRLVDKQGKHYQLTKDAELLVLLDIDPQGEQEPTYRYVGRAPTKEFFCDLLWALGWGDYDPQEVQAMLLNTRNTNTHNAKRIR